MIYGYVMTAVVGYTVDMIMAGNQQSSQVLIVTHDYEKMADAIAQNVHRGVTLLDSQGGIPRSARRWSWWCAASVKPPRSSSS